MAAYLLRLSTPFSLRQTTLACRIAFISTEPKPTTTQLVKKERKDVETVPVNDLVEVTPLTGVPETQVNRLAKIFQRAPNAMQSGTNNTHQWTMEFDNTERWENPLMGWTSR
jgi:NADH dehydrogenase (ubiquinone) Fe-S protein 4